MSPPVIVRARGLGLAYPGGAEALAGVDLEVRRGELLTIVGPSGCGKSTLLRAIAGLQRPTAGALEAPPPGGAAPVAFVFQDPTLLPWRRIVDNVALPLELAGQPAAPRRAAALAALEKVGLADAAALYPDALSGGMKMRASLARAIVTAPALLLLDEPFGALDELSRRALGEVLIDLWRAADFTAILVTHSLLEAATVGSRVVVMGRRPGTILDDVAVDLERPRGLDRGHGAALLEVVGRLEGSLAAGAGEVR
ncbi:MAG: ATP-binding cassette domain-containing protein [Nannocystaceae bacterium]